MAISMKSVSILGLKGREVEVEVDISKGMPQFNIVGLGGTEVKEAKERVRRAIENSGLKFPLGRITVNLAPADLKKEGTYLDLPIALAILCEGYGISKEDIKDYCVFGELSLSGEIRDVASAFAVVKSLICEGVKKFILPANNLDVCSRIKGGKFYPFKNLREAFMFLKFQDLKGIDGKEEIVRVDEEYDVDFNEVMGNYNCKRALEVAASGKHNILLVGPPGSGKSMLANRFHTILPQMTYEESMEVESIYSISAKEEVTRIRKRPLRKPHNTISKIGLVGGGYRLKPGEITLAHNGVMLIDEYLQFDRGKLEVLRGPMEEGKVLINRGLRTVEYPCDFTLVGTTNLCPCGNYGSEDKKCRCTAYQIEKYRNRMSGPMMDRFDIVIFLDNNIYNRREKNEKEEESKEIRKRVRESWAKQEELNLHSRKNGRLSLKELMESNRVTLKIFEQLADLAEELKISNRGFVKILRLARTIADMEGSEEVQQLHLFEAISYRQSIFERTV